MELGTYPLLEAHVLDLQAAPGAPTTDEVLKQIHHQFERLGPYDYAKSNGLLVNKSGEEFAVQFMSMYNRLHPNTY